MACSLKPELGVIGWPLCTTLSPAMHNAALTSLGLKLHYGRLPVAPECLNEFISRARHVMHGINVTMPHKQAVMQACTSVDDLGNAAGAVNTVVFDEGQIRGYNTDGPGLIKALAHAAGFVASGSSVLVLGAGGSAAGNVVALAANGAREITLLNRTRERAEQACRRFAPLYPDTKWHARQLVDAAHCQSDLILSCLPSGVEECVTPVIDTAARGTVFMDINYGDHPTRLHRTATAAGLRSVSGLEMLLWQGVMAFEIFTGREAPAAQMRDALAAQAGRWWVEC